MKEPILYKILKPIITLLIKIIYNPKIIGTENIPLNKRIVLAGNHTNNFDCLLLIASLKKPIHFLAKIELTKGIKKHLFLNMGIIPVNRKIHDKKALNEAIKALNKEKIIGIFPEGTINKTKDTILPFKIGAVKMASETDSQIVPFIITGKYKIFKNNLKIEFLKAINIPKEEDLTKYNKQLENIISKSLRKEKNKWD